MRFLVDENIKKKLTLFLRESGHEVVYAEKGLRNSSLVTRARDEGRVLLTHDTDSQTKAKLNNPEVQGFVASMTKEGRQNPELQDYLV